jgi:molybdopterin synthase catalytic subunit
VFDGIVRPAEDGRPLAALVYEAYEPMTSRELHRLAQTTLATHGLLAIVVQHSTGRVTAEEASFRLSIGAAHRAEAIRAADEFISEMKKVVPIWKTPEFAGVSG